MIAPFAEIDLVLTLYALFWMSPPFIYFMVPAVIWWVDRVIRWIDRRIRSARNGLIWKSLEGSIARSLFTASLKLSLICSIALLYIFVLFLNFHQLTLGIVEDNLWRFGFHGTVPPDFDTFPVRLVMYTTHLLLPITTVLITYYLYSAKLFNKTSALSIAAALWLIPRIGLVVAVMRYSEQRVRPHDLSSAMVSVTDLHPGYVFGGLNGVWTSSILFATLALISALVLSNARTTFRYLAVAACLCPILVLIWGTFQIAYVFVAIDYVITAYILGWMLSAVNRSKSASAYVESDHQVGRLSDVAKKVRVQTNDWIARLPAIATASPFLSKALYACRFILIAVFPAVALQWALYNLIGFRLDGSVASWATVWAVSILSGLLAFAVTPLSEHRERAIQVAVVAFLCTFAIMTFSWYPIVLFFRHGGLPLEPISFMDGWGGLFTMPIVVLGTLALIVTVVLGNHRWTWPFWACWMFIYIFVHAFAGSGYYPNDVSARHAHGGKLAGIEHHVTAIPDLALFQWINMSVIVFLFLFAIPTYFASDRCQGRARLPVTSGPSA